MGERKRPKTPIEHYDWSGCLFLFVFALGVVLVIFNLGQVVWSFTHGQIDDLGSLALAVLVTVLAAYIVSTKAQDAQDNDDRDDDC